MKYIFVVIVAIAATVAMTTTQAQEVFYRLTNVATEEHAVQCGKNGGKGAWVFDLDENGMATSTPVTACLTLVK